MNFEKIIIIRHGEYDEDTGRMNYIGRNQMERLIPKIKAYISGEANVLFLTSSAPRAEGCARVISDLLDISYEATEYLWSDKRHIQDNARALDYMTQKAEEKNQATAVIVITHLEYAGSFAEFIMEEANKDFLTHYGLEKGEMLFMDFEKETCEFTEN